VLEIIKGKIDIFVENDRFAEKAGGNIEKTNSQGYYYLGTVSK